MLSGTEADIINCVAKSREATKNQIRKWVGFSSAYIGFLCRDLIRRGYLDFCDGYYFLTRAGIKTLLKEDAPRIDRKLLKEVASEVAKEISGELKKTVGEIKVPMTVREIRKEVEKRAEEKVDEQIKIKTDFDFPVEDKSLALESNIDKIGARLEKEKSDIDKSVELFKKIQRRKN